MAKTKNQRSVDACKAAETRHKTKRGLELKLKEAQRKAEEWKKKYEEANNSYNTTADENARLQREIHRIVLMLAHWKNVAMNMMELLLTIAPDETLDDDANC